MMVRGLFRYMIWAVVLLVAGCDKGGVCDSVEIEPDSREAQFTLGELTRGAEQLKEQWSEGDRFAIFEESNQIFSKCYYIAPQRDLLSAAIQLTPLDENDQFAMQESASYRAFYPYVQGWSYADYTAAIAQDSCDTDYLCTEGFSEETTLAFKHAYAALELTVKLGYGYDTLSLTDVTSTITIGSITIDSLTPQINDDNSEATLFTFIQPDTYASNSIVLIAIMGTTSKILTAQLSTSDLSQGGCCYSVDIYISLPIEAGSGTTADPYLIYTKEDMEAVGKNENYISYASKMNNAGSAEWTLTKSYRLMNDIDLEGDEDNPWEAIGTYTTSTDNMPFTATFDGAGHTISGLYINNTDSYQGLFGYTSGATIKGVIVEGEITGGSHIGGLMGYANSSTKISQCINRADIVGTKNCGGVAGYVSSSTVYYCANFGSVTSTSTSTSMINTGGVVGRIINSSSKMENCYSIADAIKGDQFVGGVAGACVTSATVSSCYSSGKVEGGYNDGGAIGYLSSATSSNCYYNSSLYTGGETNGCTGYTTAQMTTEGTLLNSLGTVYWQADTGINNGYPILRWQVEGVTE